MSLDDLNVDIQVQKCPLISIGIPFLLKIMIGKLLKTVLIVKNQILQREILEIIIITTLIKFKMTILISPRVFMVQ